MVMYYWVPYLNREWRRLWRGALAFTSITSISTSLIGLLLFFTKGVPS